MEAERVADLVRLMAAECEGREHAEAFLLDKLAEALLAMTAGPGR